MIVCSLKSHQEASIWLLCQAAALSRTSPATFIAISDPLVWGCTDAADIEDELEVQTPPQTAESVQGVQGSAQPTAECADTTSAEQQDASSMHADTEVHKDAETENSKPISRGAGQNKGDRFQIKGEHYTKRQPVPDMAHIFRAENTILFRHQPGKLLTYVVCPGVLYGNGESDSAFHEYFARAWHASESTALPIFGSGENIVPTIHVKDLCAYVAEVTKHPPEQRYLLATDDSRCSQKQLVWAISQYIGSGESIDGVDTSLYTQQVCPSIEHGAPCCFYMHTIWCIRYVCM